MALIKEYFDLTKQYCNEYGEKTILLMQVGAFFEVYGILDKKTNNISNSQILEFSRICKFMICIYLKSFIYTAKISESSLLCWR